MDVVYLEHHQSRLFLLTGGEVTDRSSSGNVGYQEVGINLFDNSLSKN